MFSRWVNMNMNLENTSFWVGFFFVNFPYIFILSICFSQISGHSFLTVCFICGNRSFVTQCYVRENIVSKILYNHVSNSGSYLLIKYFQWIVPTYLLWQFEGGPAPQNTECLGAVVHIQDVSSGLELMQSDRYAWA